MIEKLVRKEVEEVPEYVPGRGKEDAAGKYGISLDNIAKLASNENPLGPPPMAVAEIKRAAGEVHLYPDADAAHLREAVAGYLGLSRDNIIAGNGSDEVMELVVKAFLEPGEEAVIPAPTFSMYSSLVKLYSGRVVESSLGQDFEYDLEELLKAVTPRTKLVFLCSPNNPTGGCVSGEDVERVLEREVLVVLDEAYAEFGGESSVELVERYENLVVLRTFSKAFGLAGLRAGYGVAARKTIACLARVKPPFNVSIIAQRAAVKALEDQEHLRRTVETVKSGRDFLFRELSGVKGVKVYPSQANFLLVSVEGTGRASWDVAEGLLRRGVIIRDCRSFGLGSRCIRVSVGRDEENRRFVDAFKEYMGNEGR